MRANTDYIGGINLASSLESPFPFVAFSASRAARSPRRGFGFGNVGLLTASSRTAARLGFEAWTLDGSANNQAHPRWGQAGTNYRRIAPAVYADGVSAMVPGPNSRYVSNRIFNDVGQNLFSENDISQWGWAWGNSSTTTSVYATRPPPNTRRSGSTLFDPLEAFTNDFGVLDFARTPAAPNTGYGSASPAGEHHHQLHRRVERLRLRRGPSRTGCERDPSTGTRPTTALSSCFQTATSRRSEPAPVRPPRRLISWED